MPERHQKPEAASHRPVSPRQTSLRWSFRAKLTLVCVVLSVGPVLAIAYPVVTETSNHLSRVVQEWQLTVGGDLVQTIGRDLDTAERGLVAVAAALSDSNLDETEAIALSAIVVESNEILDHAVVYDQAGIRIDAFVEEGREAAASAGERGEDEVRSRLQHSGRWVEPSVRAGRPSLRLVVPILRGDATMGYVASNVDMSPVQERTAELARTHFEADDEVSNAVFVVDAEGRAIAHSDPERVGLSVADHPAVSPFERRLIEEGRLPRMASEYELRGDGDADVVHMAGTALGVEGRPLLVVVQTPYKQAYAAVSAVRVYIGWAVAIAALLAFVVGFGVARRITRPISVLSAFALDLAARRFDKRVTIRTGDELSVLGDAMSTAAADLQASEVRLREEAAIRNDLGRYLPQEIVDEIVERKRVLALGGTRQEVSVLFADVVAFTDLSNTLSAEKTVALLNELFTLLTEIVFRNRGTVDKFVGDCLMAFWGGLGNDESHAAHALKAAQEMIRWVEAGNAGWEQEYGVRIKLAIGVNSGEVIVGNIGSTSRMEYTVIGEPVNIAAHLEAIARPNQVLTTEATVRACSGSIAVRELGPRALGSREHAVSLFELKT